MKYIISEQQSNFLLHQLLDEIFEGYTEHWVKGEKLIFVDDKLVMIWGPSTAYFSKELITQVQGVLFYDSMKDFRDSIRDWFLQRFPVSINNPNMYGIKFKDFSDLNSK